MAKRKTKNFEYYAVLTGRVSEPTIYSSWGDAHPQVTGCNAGHEGFYTLEDARKYMAENGITSPKEIIKNGAGDTTPRSNDYGYYAVANGRNPGIYRYWNGRDGSEPRVIAVSGACYKRFRTKEQAEDFIQDWEQSYTDVLCKEIRTLLNQGFRPQDMSLCIIKEMFLSTNQKADESDEVDGLGFERLGI